MTKDGAGRGAQKNNRIFLFFRFKSSWNHPFPIGGKEPGIRPFEPGNNPISAKIPEWVQAKIISARSETYPAE